MRSLKILTVLIIPLLAILMLSNLVQAASEEVVLARTVVGPQSVSSDFRSLADSPRLVVPQLRQSRRISIPFGFTPILPLRADGQEVLVSGHGSCTEGEMFTVAITVTHTASGAAAHGYLGEETCKGEAALQTWQLTAGAESEPLSVGPGEVCGLVQVHDGTYDTDEQRWCVDVKLGDYLFLPLLSTDSTNVDDR